MKTCLKFALLTICLSFFVGNVVCLAQTESQAVPSTTPPPNVVGPMSDLDQVEPNTGPLGSRAEHWRELHSGYYLDFFDVNSGVILGWSIAISDSRGVDKWGKVGSDYTAHWSNMGFSRWAGHGEVAWTSPYPYSTLTYVNAWGSGGSSSISVPGSYYQGSLYESFFDGSMVGPNGITWIDDGNATWSMLYVSDPGNYIDNRVLDMTGGGTMDWRGSVYPYGYASGYGFSFNADCRRLDSYGYSHGLQFFTDSATGAKSNGYGFWISGSSFSVWKTVGGVESSVVGWTSSTLINPDGEWNNLRVETLSGNMEFFINDASVATAYDTSLSSGYIGVGGYDGYGDGNFQFDNVTIHRQPSVLVGGEGNPNPGVSPWPQTHAGP